MRRRASTTGNGRGYPVVVVAGAGPPGAAEVQAATWITVVCSAPPPPPPHPRAYDSHERRRPRRGSDGRRRRDVAGRGGGAYAVVTMPVSQADRDYLRRLGEYEAESHAERTAEHLAADLPERLRRSLALSRRF